MAVDLTVIFTSAFLCHVATCYWIDEQDAHCEPIRIDMCSNLKYNYTKMPNFFNHRTQLEAFQEIQSYVPIVSVLNCSVHLKFFLCSMFYPMCTAQHGGILIVEACRSMCLQVKKDCEPRLSRVNVEWPAALDCSRLPEGAEEMLCMQPTDDASSGDSKRLESYPEQWHNSQNGYHRPSVNLPNIDWGKLPDFNQHTLLPSKPTAPASAGKTACPTRYASASENQSLSCDDICSAACDHCLPVCSHDILFTKEDKRFAFVWMAVLSSLCMFSTLITILTFCIDQRRFKYPVRPVVFLSFCYFIYSASYMMRLFSRPEDIMCKTLTSGDSVMILKGVDGTLCIIGFLIQYYFSMAGSMWWTILTITWFLAACKKWGQEAIKMLACYFHLAAWALPAIQTIIILIIGRVDGQELTGTCFVGNHDQVALLAFVLVPLCLHLALGATFILAGFAALFRLRSRLKTAAAGGEIQKMEKLMAKIGIFAVLYTIPAMCVVGSLVYEYLNMARWSCAAKMYGKCDFPIRDEGSGAVRCSVTKSIPTVEIFILKMLMSLAIGITSCMWILGPKSVTSWRNFFRTGLPAASTTSDVVDGLPRPTASGAAQKKRLNQRCLLSHEVTPKVPTASSRLVGGHV